jgi:heterodisulfide reductase subunit D
VKVWDALRKDLIEAGFAPLKRHDEILESIKDEQKKNPYNEKYEEKNNWISEHKQLKNKGELAFFAGCTLPLRQKDTLSNLMKIIITAGVDLAVSREEWCCNSIGLRIGDYSSIEEITSHNTKIFQDLGAKIVYTACAGCFRTMKKDYPEILGTEPPFQVKHITELLIDLLKENRIPFEETQGDTIKTAYHDPCHLGRHLDFYDIPRDVINNIPGIELIEMKRNRKNAWCCGSGGGVKSQYPDLALKISQERIEEAINSNASILTTSCPFCIGNLKDAYDELEQKLKEKIEVIDLINLIASKLKK